MFKPAFVRVALTLGLVGCGGSDGEQNTLTDPPPVGWALSLVAGADQTDTVRATLATPITVELRTADANRTPIPNVIVNFVVATPDCGAPFAGAAVTDAAGRAAERWVLGTVAKACTMEVRAVDADGTPSVFASASATVTPGAITTFNIPNGGQYGEWLGGRITVKDLVSLTDQFGNAVTDAPIALLGANGVQQLGGEVWSNSERQDELGFSAGGVTRLEGLHLAWLQDLSLSTWRVTFSCWIPIDPSANEPDSIDVTLTTTSVALNVLPAAGVINAAGHLLLTGTVSQRFPGTPGMTVAPLTHARFFVQTAGVMDWGSLEPDATSTEEVPSIYIGGNWCVREIVGQRVKPYTNNSPATMTKVVE